MDDLKLRGVAHQVGHIVFDSCWLLFKLGFVEPIEIPNRGEIYYEYLRTIKDMEANKHG